MVIGVVDEQAQVRGKVHLVLEFADRREELVIVDRGKALESVSGIAEQQRPVCTAHPDALLGFDIHVDDALGHFGQFQLEPLPAIEEEGFWGKPFGMLVAGSVDGVFVGTIDDGEGNGVFHRGFRILQQARIHMPPVVYTPSFIDLPEITASIKVVANLLNVR